MPPPPPIVPLAGAVLAVEVLFPSSDPVVVFKEETAVTSIMGLSGAVSSMEEMAVLGGLTGA